MQSWVWLVIIIVIILVVWWLMSRSTKDEPDFEIHYEEETPITEEGEGTPPEDEQAPEPKPDDLASLEGIGPKVEITLQSAGISTFAQLSAADVGKLEEILEANGLHFMDPASWPEQAQLAAEGKTEELQALHEELKGGRKAES
jgi:large subunit ribosomal protein L17